MTLAYHNFKRFLSLVGSILGLFQWKLV